MKIFTINHANGISFAFLVFFLTLAETALARDLSGNWEEEYSETIVSVEQWNSACGPTPKSTGRRKRGLRFKVEDQGIALKFKGVKKSFSTADCQTSNKAVQPKERTVKKKLFMISCSTPEDANPYENGLYSFRVKSPERIDYRETTRFSRNVSGSMCVHTKRVRRVYKKLPGPVEGSKLSDKDSEPEDSKSSAPPPQIEADPCQKPGAVVSVFIEPSHMEMTPGSKACVEVSASDSNACPVQTGLGWARRAKRPKGIKILDGKCIAVSRTSRPGKYDLHLQAAGVGVILSLSITRGTRIAAGHDSGSKEQKTKQVLKTEPDHPADGRTLDAGIVDAGTPDAGTADAEAQKEGKKNEEESSAQKKEDIQHTDIKDFSPDANQDSGKDKALPSWALPAAIGAGVLVLLLLVVIVISRRRSGKNSASHTSHEPVTSEGPEVFGAEPEAQKQPEAPPQPQPVMAPTRVEPLRAVAVDQRPKEQDAPAASSPVPSPSTVPEQQAQSSTKFCIACGEKLPAEAKFCPYCSAKQE